jgi:Uncharacterized protein conserved in bacteria (DUF2252)
MHRARQGSRFARRLVLATVCIVLLAAPSAPGQIRPDPAALASASPELVDRLRADPFTYFRFINRAWTARVCETFADVTDTPIVRLHGDAHVEQFAFTENAWGLGDFDDSTRGRTYIDIVRFLGSIDLATRQRGWTGDREKLWDRFLEGYRLGLSNPDYRPREPDIVRQLRRQAPMTRAAYLAWGESLMQPMDEATSKSVTQGMEEFDRLVRRERPQLAAGYFAVVRTGWLRIGIGSAATTKVLIRVQGPTSARGDDVLIEIKEVANLGGLGCLEASGTPQAVRVINGTRQIGRLKHDILAIGPTMLIPAAAGRAEHWLDWWVASWEPSYREVRLSDLRSVRDLSDISFDSGVQLGANKTPAVRERALSSVMTYEPRLRKETSTIVEELLAGWEELARR